VLIRGLEPLESLDLMRQLRNNPDRETNITSGPGKLCMAMSIDKRLNGADLIGTTIWIEDRNLDPGPIRNSPRVGVDYAGEYKDKPWRFYVDGNPYVSRVRFK
jgi:DNA-3-methyladenine glycosylase